MSHVEVLVKASTSVPSWKRNEEKTAANAEILPRHVPRWSTPLSTRQRVKKQEKEEKPSSMHERKLSQRAMKRKEKPKS